MKKNLLIQRHEKIDRFIIYLCLTVFSVWVILLDYKYFHFGYYDWDLAFFAQAMWNLAHGSAYVSLFDTNVFANHANLIAYLILPLYKIFPHPLTLVSLKVASYVVAGFVLYILAKEKLGFLTAAVITILYFIYPPNLFGIVYEFDFESLAPAFLMLLYYFYVKDRWGGFIICSLILILIKENLPLVILAFGIHGMFVKKDKLRWGVIPASLGIVSFYLLVFVFMPLVSHRPIGQEDPFYIGRSYQHFGGSIAGILYSLVFHPIQTCQYIITPSNLGWLKAIFQPFVYLPLLAPGVLFLISPIFAQHLMSSLPTQHSIYYAYMMTMALFVFLALVEVLVRYVPKRPQLIGYSIVSVVLVLNLINFSVYSAAIKNRYMPSGDGLDNYRWEIAQIIPKDAAVVASFCFLADLSQRKNLYAFYKLYKTDFQRGKEPFRLPDRVQYALIDYHDPWLQEALRTNTQFTQDHLKSFFASGHWVLESKYSSIVLYRRKVGGS